MYRLRGRRAVRGCPEKSLGGNLHSLSSTTQTLNKPPMAHFCSRLAQFFHLFNRFLFNLLSIHYEQGARWIQWYTEISRTRSLSSMTACAQDIHTNSINYGNIWDVWHIRCHKVIFWRRRDPSHPCWDGQEGFKENDFRVGTERMVIIWKKENLVIIPRRAHNVTAAKEQGRID